MLMLITVIASRRGCGNGHQIVIYVLGFIISHYFSTRSPVMRFLLINAFDCLAISIFLYLLVNFRDRRRRGGLSYPPGPPSWPVIGNLFDVPRETPWSAYADMSK